MARPDIGPCPGAKRPMKYHGIDVRSMKEEEIMVELLIAGIDPTMWFVHFGELGPWEATCRDCMDLRHGLCEGGRRPVECMRESDNHLDM